MKCIDDEIPFEIPQGWEWERWGNISQSIQYGYNAPALEKGVIRMVRISDIQDNKVLWNTVPFCMIEEKDIETYLLKINDILFAVTLQVSFLCLKLKFQLRETVVSSVRNQWFQVIETRVSNRRTNSFAP